MLQTFIFPVRVYYEDTDSGGVVYHANYLKFMERARTEFMRQCGCNYQDAQKQNFAFVVRLAQIEFLKPARHDDSLHVVTRIAKLGKASVIFEQIVRSAEDSNLVFCTGNIKIACISTAKKLPCAIPDFLLVEMKRGT